MWQNHLVRTLPPPSLYPDEFPEPERHIEGAVRTVIVNAYERDQAAREKCIDHYGPTCHVCEFDFERRYGPLGKRFIHVHHLHPVSKGGVRRTDPIEHLRPVCPNCHAMLHAGPVLLQIDQLRALLRPLYLPANQLAQSPQEVTAPPPPRYDSRPSGGTRSTGEHHHGSRRSGPVGPRHHPHDRPGRRKGRRPPGGRRVGVATARPTWRYAVLAELTQVSPQGKGKVMWRCDEVQFNVDTPGRGRAG